MGIAGLDVHVGVYTEHPVTKHDSTAMTTFCKPIIFFMMLFLFKSLYNYAIVLVYVYNGWYHQNNHDSLLQQSFRRLSDYLL